MSEQVLEAEAIGVQIAGKPGGEPLAQQLAALHEFELPGAGGAAEVAPDLVCPAVLDPVRRLFERGD